MPSVCEHFGQFMLKFKQIFICPITCAAVNSFVLFSSCSAVGIVRTSVIVTGVQVCSRIFMVWFITNSIRQVTIGINTSSATEGCHLVAQTNEKTAYIFTYSLYCLSEKTHKNDIF